MRPVEAANALESAASSVDFELPAPGTSGYDEWRKTGKLPEVEAVEVEEIKPPKTEAPAASEEHSAEVEDVDVPPATEEIAPAPEAGKPQGKKKDAAARLQEVLAERKKDRELIRQLTEKLTVTPSVTPQSRAAAEPEAKPAADTAAKPKPKIDDLDAQGKPVFKTYAQYEDARDEWNRGELLRLVEEKQTKTQQSAKAAEAEKVIAQSFTAKVVEARKKYADFDAVALNPELPITRGSVADQFVVESAHGPEVLYFLGENRGELDRILTLHPIGQARELFKIEQQFVPVVVAPKPALPKPPARVASQAPPPPHQVSGRSPAGDPLEKAVKDGDQAEFTRLENEKALAKMKSRRR